MTQRLRLWDNQFRLIWPIAHEPGVPAYPFIATWCNATIDCDDGTRWSGILYRCPEGIKRWDHLDFTMFQWADLRLPE